MKHIFFSIIACIVSLFPIAANAQIGYQVSLLNTATGEPRAGVTVNATVTITDSADKTIYTGTQRATANDFGVLSLTVGNADTFSKADYSKLPFFISVSVDGALIGKSQILSVPVAEYAKKTGELAKEILVGKWNRADDASYFYTFHSDGTCSYCNDYRTFTGKYIIEGNMLVFINDDMVDCDNFLFTYFPSSPNMLVEGGGTMYIKQ